MKAPSSTYRLQLNRSFRFSEAEKLVDYLETLGVGELYCSPVLTARSGSVHCYDVTDPTSINHELGGETGLRALASKLRRSGMGLLLDIVPNHMSTSSENPFWMDVLEYGQSSPYCDMFDVDWHPPQRRMEGRVLLPLLPGTLSDSISSGSVRVSLRRRAERPLSLSVGGQEIPLAPESYTALLSSMRDHSHSAALRRLASGLLALLPPESPHLPGKRRAAAQAMKTRLAKRIGGSGVVGLKVDTATLLDVLDRQHYRLVSWRDAATKINYRRFLNVNELVAVRVEDPRIFEATHRLIIALLRSGEAAGVRVDHADGLRDPELYFQRLSSASGDAYVVAEKILMTGRRLPEWHVSGTTGYDSLNDINGVLVKADNAEALEGVYRRFTRDRASYEESVRSGKLTVMRSMGAELRRLAGLLSVSAPSVGPGDLEAAVRAVVSNFDGYRTYITPRTRSVGGSQRERIIRAVQSSSGGVRKEALSAVRDALLLKGRGRRALEFALRFQQFTAAVAVKGEEDTALYRYVRLSSLNEVGGDPSRFGTGLSEFHRRCRRRFAAWPQTMVTTSTHDTKRSEDVRARISAISEMPSQWESALGRWHRLTAVLRARSPGGESPSPRDEYLFYQTLLGAWPHRDWPDGELTDRLVEYMLKASREARAETSWWKPDPAYERALVKFVRGALGGGRRNRFLRDASDFERRLDWFGMLNSLSQALLKFTVPGVPDTYQGNEVWDYSLVDPDNRRPVDFRQLGRSLVKLDSVLGTGGAGAAARATLGNLSSGMAKMYVTTMTLRFRRDRPRVFREGAYAPCSIRGTRSENLVAFTRGSSRSGCLVCVPRFFSELCAEGEFPLGRLVWGETTVSPQWERSGTYINIFTGRKVSGQTGSGKAGLSAAEIFEGFPVALLKPV